MSKKGAGVDSDASDVEGDQAEGKQYISPVANPLLEGKLLDKGLKVLRKSVAYDLSLREVGKAAKEVAGSTPATVKAKRVAVIKRGVAEVTKSIRKGSKGIVFLASDVFPVDIISHLPVYCEDKDILYCFIGSKKSLGAACKTKRPASVIMVVEPEGEMPYGEHYHKFHSSLKKAHPYF